jgi:AraC-like DNA-binding protein
METKNTSYGLARITKYLPTAKAETYLHCCLTAGWHSCNRTYRQNYPDGVNCVLMVCTLKGGGWIRSGEKHWELKPGSIATVPPDIPIEYGTSIQKKEDIWEFYWLNLTGDLSFLNAGKIWNGGGMAHLCRSPSFFQQIFRWLHEPDGGPSATEIERSARLQELFHQLFCELFFDADTGPSGPQYTAGQMLEYIHSNYHRPIPLEDLRRHFYLSPNQLIRSFQKVTGYTPHEYLQRYRLNKACELLLGTDLPTGEIGRRVGYPNNSHFTAQFRQCYGMTPTAYRRSGFFT